MGVTSLLFCGVFFLLLLFVAAGKFCGSVSPCIPETCCLASSILCHSSPCPWLTHLQGHQLSPNLASHSFHQIIWQAGQKGSGEGGIVMSVYVFYVLSVWRLWIGDSWLSNVQVYSTWKKLTLISLYITSPWSCFGKLKTMNEKFKYYALYIEYTI